MTRYQGGKARLGADLAAVMLDVEACFAPRGSLNYFEPMCGMMGVFKHMATTRKPPALAIACDGNQQVMDMWQLLQQGWVPEAETSEHEFNTLKQYITAKNKNPPVTKLTAQEQKRVKEQGARCGVVGHACAFGGNYFSGYVGLYDKKKTPNEYMRCAVTSLLKVLPSLQGSHLMEGCDYAKHNPKGNLIYLDPPYLKGQKNASNQKFRQFSHEKFWKDMNVWVRTNIVIVSEESAPPDWIPVFTKAYSRTSNHWLQNREPGIVTKKVTKERLFMHRSQAKIYLQSLHPTSRNFAALEELRQYQAEQAEPATGSTASLGGSLAGAFRQLQL